MSATPPSLPFAIEEIERELARLWQSAPGIDRRHELALSRTSVLTLFVYAPDRARAAWVRQVISRLSIYHPSRVVLFVTSHDQPLEEPEISIQCDLGIAERYAPCYEQVTITLPSDGLELLPSLVIPLALPDLPAVLWWLGPLPCQDRRFVRVARAVDRLIFDSLEQSQPLRDLVSTRRLVQQVSRTTVVSDLNWSRLSPWQETTARIFDIPHCRWALTAIERVDLRFGVASEQPSRNPIQVLLYLGWLANRLAWRLDDVQVRATGWELTFSSPRNAVSVTVSREDAPETLHGHLLAVQLTARRSDESATFTIELSGDERATIRLRAYQGEQCIIQQAFHHNLLNIQRLLSSELPEVPPDPLYEEALDEATGIAVELLRHRDEAETSQR